MWYFYKTNFNDALFIKIKVWFNMKQPIHVNILKEYNAMKCDENWFN